MSENSNQNQTTDDYRDLMGAGCLAIVAIVLLISAWITGFLVLVAIDPSDPTNVIGIAEVFNSYVEKIVIVAAGGLAVYLLRVFTAYRRQLQIEAERFARLERQSAERFAKNERLESSIIAGSKRMGSMNEAERAAGVLELGAIAKSSPDHENSIKAILREHTAAYPAMPKAAVGDRAAAPQGATGPSDSETEPWDVTLARRFTG